jgi:outer membrane immunogenic protein
MPKLLTILALLLLAGCASEFRAYAQTAPRADIAVTYDWTHSNAPPGDCGCFSLNGGSGSFAWRISPTVHATVEIGGAANGTAGGAGYGLTLMDFLAGAQYAPRVRSRIHPFGEVLLGAAHASGGLSPETLGFGSSNAFAFKTGGGFDFRLAPGLAFRVVDADYLLTLFSNRTNDHQNNVRLSSGLVFRF